MKNTIPLFCSLCLLSACRQQAGEQEAAAPGAAYREPYRPQFHFSPPAKWMNDPNGMFFYEGEYHLFYQYYPDSTVWGPMHWGHAVSVDLVHWQHLPIALYPDSLGYIFSGSAVVDWNNTSGLGRNGQPPLIAIFTYHNPELEQAGRSDFQYQGIAYSNDKGRTWTKYEGNPVVPNTEKIRDFRDPKVIWHEPTRQWIMVFAAADHVKFYGSPNLIDWIHLSDFGREWGVHAGVWECPDLFPLEVDGTGETKWALLLSINPGAPNGGSGTQYFVGDFDGMQFTLDPSFAPAVKDEKGVWLDYGRDNYAGVTWSDIPAADGRRLFIGWMSNWDYAQVVPTDTWRSAMTLPRTLTLNQTANGYRVFSRPVEELQVLRTASQRIEMTDIEGVFDIALQAGVSPFQMELIIDWEWPAGGAPDFGVELTNGLEERFLIGYNAAVNQFYSDRTQMGNTTQSSKFAHKVSTAPRIYDVHQMRMHLFFDAASVELFADDGSVAMTEVFFPEERFSSLKLFSHNGKVKLLRGEAHGLKRIWPGK